MNFKDVKKLTARGNYRTDVNAFKIERTLATLEEDYVFDMSPDYQRGHVWTEEQQIAYVEFRLRGGQTGRDIIFNCLKWDGVGIAEGEKPVIELVDGKQRLTAWRRFIANEIRAFGVLFRDFEGFPPDVEFQFFINDLKTKKEVLAWYLELNSGGTPHSKEEIDRVRGLLEEFTQEEN